MRLRAESTDPASVQADVLAIPIYKEDKEISGAVSYTHLTLPTNREV